MCIRDRNIPAHISRLKSLGIRALVDDFSMGSTSLKYLQHNSFYAVKLDGSLVKGVVDNPRNQEIIASIVKLGKSLDLSLIHILNGIAFTIQSEKDGEGEESVYLILVQKKQEGAEGMVYQLQ